MSSRRGLRSSVAQLKGSFSFLLIMLLLVHVVHPFFMEHPSGRYLLHLGLTIIVLSGIFSVTEKKVTRITALILVVAWISALSLNYLYHRTDSLLAIAYLSGIVLLVFNAAVILSHVLRETDVTANTIYGALCVFMLMALAWALVYSLLELLQPGSFNFPDLSAQGHHFILSRLIYYSYVTITTVGYGDITPKSFPARNLSNVEAIMGQIYMTVLVARLVSLQITSSSKS